MDMKNLPYLSGFGNHFESEALPNALSKNQNSPQHLPYELYAEQINGTAFTSLRHQNLRSWLYRLRPSAAIRSKFTPYSHASIDSNPVFLSHFTPEPLRWLPLPYPEKKLDFFDSWVPYAGHGSPNLRQGGSIYMYACNHSYKNRYFYNADGDLLFIPQEGGLRLHTEFGILEIEPNEIAIIYRGMQFKVELLNDQARGYLCENFGSPFTLPERGLIGANGLANTRDFFAPVACLETHTEPSELLCKFNSSLWLSRLFCSPLDVAAWHGNYVPYKYDLRHFNTINTVSYDHPDPSIFTVLTSPSYQPGIANIDFVIFPEYWLVAEHTFRPPYYHRNIMSEFMGLIKGRYAAKKEGFLPGGASLHNCMTAHGPDTKAYEKAVHETLKPQYLKGSLAFMLESFYPWQPSQYMMNSPLRQKNYLDCWKMHSK